MFFVFELLPKYNFLGKFGCYINIIFIKTPGLCLSLDPLEIDLGSLSGYIWGM